MVLNEGIIDFFYGNVKIKRCKVFCVFGVDASKVVLLKTKEIEASSSRIALESQHIETSYTCALFESRYDLLNYIVIQSSLYLGSSYEAYCKIKMLE